MCLIDLLACMALRSPSQAGKVVVAAIIAAMLDRQLLMEIANVK